MKPTNGMDRGQFHDRAWALWQEKALNSALLPKLSIHAIRTLWDSLYDSMPIDTSDDVAQGAEPVSHEVFLVTADTLYEGSDAVRAFVRKEDAEAFAKKCQEYAWTYKSCPSVHASESDRDKWQEDDRAWYANHPAGPYTQSDLYSVTPIAIEGCALPAQTASPINQCDGCRVGAPAVHLYADGSRIGCTRDMYGVQHPEGIPTRVDVTCEFTDVIEQLEVIDAKTFDGVVHVAVRMPQTALMDAARDAARYRFARDNIMEGHRLPGGFYLSDHSGANWDRTIDAALADSVAPDAIAPESYEWKRDAFVRDVAAQTPEMPNYWSSCWQCGNNIERAQDLLDAAQAASEGNHAG